MSLISSLKYSSVESDKNWIKTKNNFGRVENSRPNLKELATKWFFTQKFRHISDPLESRDIFVWPRWIVIYFSGVTWCLCYLLVGWSRMRKGRHVTSLHSPKRISKIKLASESIQLVATWFWRISMKQILQLKKKMKSVSYLTPICLFFFWEGPQVDRPNLMSR